MPLRTGRRDWLWISAGVAMLIALGLFLATRLPAKSVNTYAETDGVKCQSGEQLAHHAHVRLQIIVLGLPVTVPKNVGIDDDKCLFWLHTHDDTGLIHVESPENTDFVLGQFFSVWKMDLSSTVLLDKTTDADHLIRATVNGNSYQGDPAQIPLRDGDSIVLQYGPPFASTPGP